MRARKLTDVWDRARRGALACLLALLVLAPAAPGASAADPAGVDLRLADSLDKPRRAADAATVPGADDADDTGYRIDTGDRVSITVYDEPDLSVTDARVRDSGTISFPLIGELRIRGMTIGSVKRTVTEKLAEGYLKNPSVTVSVDRYRLYFIRGEVARPGGYSYVDGLTVEKAVALAGGFTDRAAESDITLIREATPEKPMKDIELHTRILPGDVVKVGESFF